MLQPHWLRISWLLVLIISFLGFSCGFKDEEKSFVIGFSQCTGGDAWRQSMHEAMKRELVFHPELELIIKDAERNNSKQINDIESFLEEKVDLVIISPNEAEPITAAVEKVYNSGIPVIVIDRKTISESFTAYIGSDNVEIGQTAGHYIADLLGGKGKIIEILGLRGSTPAQDRHKGFRQIIDQYPGIDVIAEVEGEWEIGVVIKKLPEVLKKFQEVDLIFAHNDVMARGAWEVKNAEKISKKIYFIGVDGLSEDNLGMQWVADSILTATFLYPTGGEEAISLAADILNKRSFKRETLLNTTVIDSRNVRIMQMQSEKIGTQQEDIVNQKHLLDQQMELYRNQRIFLYILSASLALAIFLGASTVLSLRAKKLANQNLEIKNQEVILQRNQTLEMADKAREATEAKFQFFTNISHEFRTPLTLVQGSVDSLLSGEKSGEKRKDLGLIRKNSDRLLRLINQLMDFRKIENGKMKVRVTEQDLVSFIREIMQAYEKQAQMRKIDFSFFSREPSLKVWFEGDMLDKVIFNLLSNSFKFTRDKGRIHVTLIKDELTNQAVITVEDNGRGMSREHAENAFERFYQGDTYSTQGTGLGLSLSKALIELHHGEISVESESGIGTRFYIKLPLGITHFTEEEIATQSPESFIPDHNPYYEDIAINPGGKLSAGIKDQQILLIEDNEDLQEFLTRKLSPDYEMLSATDGNIGIDLAYEHVPDLIICDVMLPGKDGIQISKKLKSDLRTSHIPIILLTARSSREQKLEGLQTGADIYLTKPFDLAVLQENIKTLLRNRATLKEYLIGDIEITSSTPDKLNKQFISEFKAIVEANYTDPAFGVNEICTAIGLSRVQLYRKVKAMLDCSVNDYIQNIRLENAKYLLKTGNMNVAEIAYNVGYTSPSYFSTAFKTKYGKTPSTYRK